MEFNTELLLLLPEFNMLSYNKLTVNIIFIFRKTPSQMISENLEKKRDGFMIQIVSDNFNYFVLS